MRNKICGIYEISFKGTEKTYIGQSVDFRSRRTKHKSRLKNNKHVNPHLQNVYNKYGLEAMSIEIVELCPKELLNEREYFYIHTSKNSMNHDKSLLNVTMNLNSEQILSRSKQLDSVRESAMEKWRTPIIAYNIESEELTTYESLKDACEIYSEKSIYKNLNGNLTPSGGIVFFKSKEDFLKNVDNIIQSTNNNSPFIELYTKLNLLSGEVTNYPNLKQLSLGFLGFYDHYVFDKNEFNIIDNCIIFKGEVPKQILNLGEYAYIYRRTKRSVIGYKLEDLISILQSHKTISKTSKVLGISRETLRNVFKKECPTEILLKLESIMQRHDIINYQANEDSKSS